MDDESKTAKGQAEMGAGRHPSLEAPAFAQHDPGSPRETGSTVLDFIMGLIAGVLAPYLIFRISTIALIFFTGWSIDGMRVLGCWNSGINGEAAVAGWIGGIIGANLLFALVVVYFRKRLADYIRGIWFGFLPAFVVAVSIAIVYSAAILRGCTPLGYEEFSHM